jgi:hypothetical protein
MVMTGLSESMGSWKIIAMRRPRTLRISISGKPGMMGRLRLAASPAHPAMLVPDTAIVTDAARRVVYVVDKQGTVTMRPVQLGPLDGSLRVIRTGLGPQDQVVIGGIQRAMPGQKVRRKKGRILPSAATPGPDAPPPQAAPASAATSAS